MWRAASKLVSQRGAGSTLFWLVLVKARRSPARIPVAPLSFLLSFFATLALPRVLRGFPCLAHEVEITPGAFAATAMTTATSRMRREFAL